MEVRGRSGQGAALKKAEALGKKGKEQKTIMLFEKKMLFYLFLRVLFPKMYQYLNIFIPFISSYSITLPKRDILRVACFHMYRFNLQDQL